MLASSGRLSANNGFTLADVEHTVVAVPIRADATAQFQSMSLQNQQHDPYAMRFLAVSHGFSIPLYGA